MGEARKPLPAKISFGDKYGPAMLVTTPAFAAEYFEACVEHCMRVAGKTREQAEAIERENLGYWAGYYDDETRARVEHLFATAHPIFGKIAEKGQPTPEEAFAAGVRFAEEAKARAKARAPVYCQHPLCVAALAEELAARGLTVEPVELHKDPAAAQVPCLHGPAGPAEST